MRPRSFAKARHAELRCTGQTIIPASTAKLVLFLVMTLAFTALGFLLMLMPLLVTSTTKDPPGGAIFVGVLIVLFFGVVGIPSLVRQIIQRRRLVLDRTEMRLERRRSGQWETMSRYAWADIESVVGARVGARWPFRGQLLVTLVLAPGAYAQGIARQPTWKSGLQSLNEHIVGDRTHSLPNAFGWKTRPLLELISSVHAETA